MNSRIKLFLAVYVVITLAAIYYAQRLLSAPEQQTVPTAPPTVDVNATPTSIVTPVVPTPTVTPVVPTPTPIVAYPTSTPLATEVTASRCDNSPWQFTTNMTTGRMDHAVALVSNYLFAFGGYAGAIDAGVERTLIKDDGRLAEWQRVGELPMARAYMAAVAHGNYIYIIGGETGNGIDKNVERVHVNIDGALGPWESMSSLTSRRANSSAVLYNGFIYVIGGLAPDYTPIDSIERAKIHPDGTLSSWELMAPLATPRYRHTTILAAPHLYVIGGYGDDERNDIERTTIASDGTLSAWIGVGTLTASRTEAAGLAYQGYIYLFGGNHFGTPTNLVERSLYDNTEALTEWTQLNPSYLARSEIVAITKENHVYLIGGRANGGEPVDASFVEWTNLNQLTASSENGLSINNGALYTNQTGVTLNISGQPGATLMQVSNDGGFAGATWEPCVRQKPWTITQFGNSIIPRVVYTRFRDEKGNTSSVVQDDIILDVTAPSGSVTVVPGAAAQQISSLVSKSRKAPIADVENAVYLPLISAIPATCPATGAPNVTVQLSAQDDVSGVAEMMISNDAGFPCAAWQPFTAVQLWYVPPTVKTTVYAKFRDYAGNISTTVQDSIQLTIPNP